MAAIDGHENVIQNGRRELAAKRVPHQGEIEA
jgi:hypothetical protein